MLGKDQVATVESTALQYAAELAGVRGKANFRKAIGLKFRIPRKRGHAALRGDPARGTDYWKAIAVPETTAAKTACELAPMPHVSLRLECIQP